MLIYGMFPLLKNADMLMSTIVKQRRIRVDMSRCSHLVSSTPEKVNGIPALSKKACKKNEYYKNIYVFFKLKSIEK